MLTNMKLRGKFILFFLLIGLLPLAALAIIAVSSSTKALSKHIFDELDSVQQLKKEAIETYFQDMFFKMKTLANSTDVQILYNRLFQYHNDMKATPTGNYDVSTKAYKEIWEKFGSKIYDYYKASGVYDIFLICAKHGHVMYTAAKENDLGENLGYGKYKDSGLGKIWSKVKEKGLPSVVDMAPYAPSNGDPALFTGYPFKNTDGSMIGIMVFQIPLDQINKVMTSRYGVGKTGESYLVGPDKLMRSDSYLDPENHTVAASFANPEKGRVDTTASKNALAGRSGSEIIIDYNGHSVLSSYGPLKIKDLTWAIITEKDETEAFKSIISLNKKIALVVVIAIIVILIVAFLISQFITAPILKGIAMANKMAEGNLTLQLDIKRNDEIGTLANVLNGMAKKLREMFGEIAFGTQTLTTSSTELSAVSEQMAKNSRQTSEKSTGVSAAAEEMSSNMNSVAAATEQATTNIQIIVSAAEEMTSTINEIVGNTANGRDTTSRAVETARQISQKVDQLGGAALEISKVTETIAEISEQTNLLALNATIEAARAGEQGKGFAVVAEEIKLLAQQTAEATTEISSKIAGIQSTTKESVMAIESIVAVIDEINSIVIGIATAIEEQTAATHEIANSVSQAATGLDEVNENISQTSVVVEKVTKDIVGVNQASKEMNAGSHQVMTSATELSQLAKKLNEMMSQFTI